jgi:two-component system, NarL family, nitrate/nitrite response regulator NarL
MAGIKVMLIEDNRLLREGIATALTEHDGFEVIALAEDGDAIDKLKEAGEIPDVVLLDLGLEKTNSLQLMGLLSSELPVTKIIAMDILPDQDDVIEFVEAGGSGFILKSASLEDYVSTIQKVVKGEKVLPTVLTASLFTNIVESALSSGNGIPESAVQLTNREREIVDLISKGLSNKEIANHLHIATHTVKSHVHNILEKLTLNSRLQIAAFARHRDSK